MNVGIDGSVNLFRGDHDISSLKNEVFKMVRQIWIYLFQDK
jgi:hypothetical protein